MTEAVGGSPSLNAPDYWWYRERSELLRVVLAPYLRAPRRVLDVGSADGPSVDWLRGHGVRVPIDVDVRGLEEGGVCASAMALPFPDGTFDVVTAFDVLEHCEDEALALSEMARVLAPGGRLLLSVPAYNWAWTIHDDANGHLRRYTRRRLRRAVHGADLEIVRLTHAFAGVFPFFAASRITDRIKHGKGDVASVAGLTPVSPGVDRFLTRMCRFDRSWLASHDLSFGSSVVLAAIKPSEHVLP